MNAIAEQIRTRYPTSNLEHHYRLFEWNGDPSDAAWAKRADLSGQLQTAVRSGDLDKLLVALQAIHDWGFPKKKRFPAAIQEQGPAILDALRAQQHSPREGDVASLLGIYGVGIATASKWVCFLDQTRYAIFDSRVSVALREVCVDSKRCFPVLPRDSKNAWPNDYVSKRKMARFYVLYLEALAALSPSTGFKPAEIEMALFMIGDEPCSDAAEWKAKARRTPLAR